MVYTRNQPVAGDDLDFSQPFLTNNTNGADDSFGIEHYPFSDLTGENGLHNTVTTPGYVNSPPDVPVAPPVTTTYPRFYGFEPLDGSGTPTTNLGLLQYSRGPTNALPSPVTFLQSPSTPVSVNNVTNPIVLDFAGITSMAICNLYMFDRVASIAGNVQVFWNGSAFTFIDNTNAIRATSTGSILKLTTSNVTLLTNVFWTMQMLRIQY